MPNALKCGVNMTNILAATHVYLNGKFARLRELINRFVIPKRGEQKKFKCK